jgi:hypothetical protein
MVLKFRNRSARHSWETLRNLWAIGYSREKQVNCSHEGRKPPLLWLVSPRAWLLRHTGPVARAVEECDPSIDRLAAPLLPIRSTARVGHQQIDDHGVGEPRAHAVQPFGSTRRGLHGVAEPLHDHSYGTPEIGVVVHYKNAPRAGVLSARVAVLRLVSHHTARPTVPATSRFGDWLTSRPSTPSFRFPTSGERRFSARDKSASSRRVRPGLFGCC